MNLLMRYRKGGGCGSHGVLGYGSQ
jgi:hypothetical protein